MSLPGLPSHAVEVPDVFYGTQRFQPLALLGRGSMGVVHKVWDRDTDTHVALKTLPARGPDQLYHLKQEFRALAGLVHPNLVELYELIVDPSQAFFTMELVEGTTFTGAAAQTGFSEPRSVRGGEGLLQLLDATEQLVLGLAALHAKGKLHRDVKPPNVLITPTGRVVLLDFGLAAALELPDRASMEETFVGTPAYMAPELAWGKAPTTAADWYSVGTLLYETLVGRLPFTGSPQRILFDKTHGRPAPPRAVAPDVPEPLDALITALLEAEPQRRPDVHEILRRLRECHVSSGARRHTFVAGGEASVPFVGRDAELTTLRELFAAVRTGQRAICHIEGPSGIGKSELARRFVHDLRAAEPPPLVLSGRCRPQEAVPYNALDSVIDALSRTLLSLPEAVLAPLLPPGVEMLTQVFPVLRRVPALSADAAASDAEPHEIRRRGISALRELLVRLSAHQPLVVCIDDIHWGDLDSASVLRELLRSPEAPRLLLLLTYRDNAEVPLLTSLEAHAEEFADVRTVRLRLGPLHPDDARSLARQLCPTQAAQDERIAGIAFESSGSPFLLCELARHFAASASPTAAPAPSAMRLTDVVSQRVQQLAGPARRVLEIVSVAGRPLERSFALRVAGLGERGRTVVSRLAEACLVRSAIRSEEVLIEPYHDRISEALIAGLSADDLQHRHGELADALAGLATPDPEALFRHSLGAGRRGPAADWAEHAGDRASSTLAFARAADLYRQALQLREPAAASQPLQVKLAAALSNAGLGRDAGEAFETAAQTAAQYTPDQVLALRGQAADQYLRSGYMERGTALLRDVLVASGISLPGNSRTAALRSLVERLRFFRRGVAFDPQAPEQIPVETRVRLNTFWAGAAGLSLLDPIMADALGVRCLIEALNAGDVDMITRTLGHEAASEAGFGGRFFRRRNARLLRALDGATHAAGTPFAHAAYDRAVGISAYFFAHWRAAAEHCARATTIWREQCRGAFWEATVVESFHLSALAHLGEIHNLSRRLSGMLADADARGDVYGGTSVRMGVPAIVWLAQDRAEHARALADEAIARWPRHTFLVQHFLHLVSTVQADLYLGDVWRAWQRICVAWPQLVAAQIPRVAVTRVELHHLRARVALAAAAAEPRNLPDGALPADPAWPRTRLLRQAKADAKRIQRDDLPTVRPFAAAIHAGLALAERRDAEALRQLLLASEAFRNADMRLYAAACDVAAAGLQHGADGQHLEQGGMAWMREQGVVNPSAMTAMLCPLPRSR
jgi:hypothetical protein